MILREMLVDDLDQVMEIEQDLFHVPWTKEGFFTFLTRDDAMFLVVEEKEKILGYCGDKMNMNVAPDEVFPADCTVVAAGANSDLNKVSEN